MRQNLVHEDAYKKIVSSVILSSFLSSISLRDP